MPSRRMVNRIYVHLLEGRDPESIKKFHGQLHDAARKQHPWAKPSANPSGRWAGKRGPGRTAAQRSGPPPGWVDDAQNMKNMAGFLSATGNAGTVTAIAKAQQKKAVTLVE